MLRGLLSVSFGVLEFCVLAENFAAKLEADRKEMILFTSDQDTHITIIYIQSIIWMIILSGLGIYEDMRIILNPLSLANHLWSPKLFQNSPKSSNYFWEINGNSWIFCVPFWPTYPQPALGHQGKLYGLWFSVVWEHYSFIWNLFNKNGSIWHKEAIHIQMILQPFQL